MSNIYNFALLGHPIGHSRSPELHREFLKQKSLKGDYILIDTPPAKLHDHIYHLRDLGFRGANITIPHKEAVLEILDEHHDNSDHAPGEKSPIVPKKLSACNTIEFAPSGKIIGYNTDEIGFRESLLEHQEYRRYIASRRNTHEKIIILGTGGSAITLARELGSWGSKNITFVTRKRLDIPAQCDLQEKCAVSSGKRISASPTHQEIGIHNEEGKGIERGRIGGGLAITYKDIKSHIEDNGEHIAMILNCTPVGMHGHSEGLSPLPDDFPWEELPKHCLVYDLIYNPEETELLKQARAHGLPTQNGLRMLRLQAAAAFEIWTGKKLVDLR